MTTIDRVLNTKQAARLAGVTADQIRQALHTTSLDADFPPLKGFVENNRYKIRASELNAWIETREKLNPII